VNEDDLDDPQRDAEIYDDLWACDSTANSWGPLTDTLCHKLCGMRLQQWTRRLAKQTRQACRCNGKPSSSPLAGSDSFSILNATYYILLQYFDDAASYQIFAPNLTDQAKICQSLYVGENMKRTACPSNQLLLLTSQAYSCVSGFKCGTQSSKFRATWFFESLVLVVIRFQPMAHICVAQSSRCLPKYFPFGFPKPIASNDQTASTVRQIYLQDWNILKYSHIYSRTCLNF